VLGGIQGSARTGPARRGRDPCGLRQLYWLGRDLRTAAGIAEISASKHYTTVVSDADASPDLPDHPWLAKAREILRRRGVQDPAVIDAEVRLLAERLGLIGKPKQNPDE
jgi:hypothetical protein